VIYLKRKMLKNKTIVFLIHHQWDWSTDYQNQTAKILQQQKNLIIIYYSFKESAWWKKSFWLSLIEKRDPNFIFFIPCYLLPLRRFKLIKKVNRQFNQWRFNQLVKRKQNQRKLTCKDILYWFFLPDSLKLSQRLLNLKKRKIVFDCIDYFPNKRDLKKAIGQSAWIFSIGENIKEYLEQHNPEKKQINLVPQGFDFENFKKIKTCRNTFPTDKPIIGYVGGINERLDYPLLIKLVKNNPQWNFVFWGPWQASHLNKKIKKQLQKLEQLENTIFGESDKKAVPAIIKQFDIGIIPYDVKKKYNLYCYPMKLFEYFYCGKPVISTPIEELKNKKFTNSVKIANSETEWAINIKDLLDVNWSEKNQNQQLELALANSWNSKIESIEKIIETT